MVSLKSKHRRFRKKARHDPLMRISRTFPGKKYAIIFDYIFDHPIFYYQLFNPKKRNYRLKAYQQCTEIHQVVDELVFYLKAKAGGRTQPEYKMRLLNKYKDDIIIDVDEVEI